MQMRTGRIARIAAIADHFATCHPWTRRDRASLHGQHAHVSINGRIAVRVVELDVQPQRCPMILGVPPAGVAHFIGLRGRI